MSTSTSSRPGSPPAVLRLSGHPVRWRLLSELSRSDRQVRELTELVGERQSLTSYHLRQLRGGGLVTMRRSSADRRDSYYSLDLRVCRDRLAEAGADLHPGLRLVPSPLATPGGDDAGPGESLPPTRVLFLCTGNSARSQMAQGILEHLAGSRVEVTSAGSHPRELHPTAVEVMGERGIDLRGRRTRHLRDLVERPFDHVVSLCDRVREVCPDFPGDPAVAHWSMPDPAARAAEAVTPAEGREAFERTADELELRIHFLLHAIQRARTNARTTSEEGWT